MVRTGTAYRVYHGLIGMTGLLILLTDPKCRPIGVAQPVGGTFLPRAGLPNVGMIEGGSYMGDWWRSLSVVCVGKWWSCIQCRQSGSTDPACYT